MAHVQITDQTPRAVYAVGGTPQSAFAIPWAFFAATDIALYVDGVQATFAAVPVGSLQFSVSGTAADGGFSSGTATLGAAVSNATVVISRVVPIARTEDFPYPSATLDIRALNTAFDKLVAMAQQLRRDLDRALRLRPEDALTTFDIPPVAQRASKLLGFDANGQAIATPGVTLPYTGVISTFAETLLDDADAATARTTLDAASTGSVTSAVAALQALALLRDGSQAATGALAMGANRITGLAAATAGSDAARWDQIGGWIRDNTFMIAEERADGVDGGVITAGSWQDRSSPLIEQLDPGNLVSVSSTTFTVQPGTYDLHLRVPLSNGTGGARVRLYSVTDAAAVPNSTSASHSYGNAATYTSNNWHEARVRATFAAATQLRMQYFAQANASGFGFGQGVNDGITAGPEIYAQVIGLRLS